MAKIGLMGGTFDPIHNGHLLLAKQALTEFGLDRVLFIPNHIPWMKSGRKITNDQDRVDMVLAAIANEPRFEISYIEMNAGGNSYTCNTVQQLCKEHPEHEYFFIMGADSLFDFDQWREPQRIVNAAHIVVATRNQTDPDVFNRLLDQRREEFHGDFLKLDTPNLDISSKHIRELIRNGISARYYLPDPVREYIRKNRIYLSSAENEEKVACSGKG